MSKLLSQIDFGSLVEPEESPRKRAAFCSKAVIAKPVVEEIAKRMLRALGRDYFGKIQDEVSQAYINGHIAGIQALVEQVYLLEAEHLDKQQKEIEPDEPTIISGSELGL